MTVRLKFGSTAAIALAIALFFLGPNLHAQSERGIAHRPKIGLVLSGGGARGVAHAGVLKALEELHIPVDCIAGTSMGAVVGGLYASGMSPGQIEDWFRNADWHYMLSDSVPRESESLRTKQRDFDLHQGIAFELSRKAGVKLPAALSSGRNFMANLRQLTLPVRHVRNFDRLPIPFRAVATDVETGELVVLRDGDFVESIRASMSVPAIFTPQKIDGRLLVDGGIASNLPIQTMQEMGADAIIAIDVSEGLKKEAELDTAIAMANQVLNIFIQKQTREQIARLGPGDALIRLKLEDIGTTELAKAGAGIQSGYDQVMQKRTALARFSVAPAQFDEWIAKQRVPREAVQISFLKVRTPSGETGHRLTKPIDFETSNPARFAPLQSKIADLGEMQKYDVADYKVIGQPGDYGLLIRAREKKGGPTFLNFGFDFDYSSADETGFNFLLGLRMTELNHLGAAWETFLSVGDSTRIESEWYQPIDSQRSVFLAPLVLWGSDFINGRDGNGAALRFRQMDFAAGIDLGARLGQAGEFRIGYARGVSRITRRLGVPSDVPSTSDRGWMHADLTMDTLDAPSFAERGYYGRVSVIASREEFGAADNYTRLEGQLYKPLTFGKNTIVPRVSVAVKLGDGRVPLYDQVPLGGFLNLSGLARGGLFDQNAALAELIYYRKLAELSPAMGRGIYGGFSLEAGEVWANARDFGGGNIVYGGSIFLGADTMLGALHLGVGLAEGGNAAVYLQLGPVFRQGRHQR
jgi:NTE family protein